MEINATLNWFSNFDIMVLFSQYQAAKSRSCSYIFEQEKDATYFTQLLFLTKTQKRVKPYKNLSISRFCPFFKKDNKGGRK